MTEQAALHQLREAYRGTSIEVRFFPDCGEIHPRSKQERKSK